MKKLGIFIIGITLFFQFANAQDAKKGDKLSDAVLNINVFDQNGNSATLGTVLESFKGSVLYIDFWASWCGPCRNEMPHSKLLKQKFNSPKVQFLYFSTDETDEAWKMGIEKLSLSGNLYRLDKDTKAEIQKFFNIKGIPYFIILDKNGKIFETNASWPREEGAYSEIEKALIE